MTNATRLDFTPQHMTVKRVSGDEQERWTTYQFSVAALHAALLKEAVAPRCYNSATPEASSVCAMESPHGPCVCDFSDVPLTLQWKVIVDIHGSPLLAHKSTRTHLFASG